MSKAKTVAFQVGRQAFVVKDKFLKTLQPVAGLLQP
jgi:hypothetical protein